MRLKLYTFFIFCLLFSKSYLAGSQTYGCTDPYANNYMRTATINNGSCTYDPTSYSPLSKVNPISNVLVESSGLQMAGNSLWSFNDGGGAAAIYRIDTLTNTVFQTVNLGGATNVDWEDIAFDGTYFYVGDFGNNADGYRSDLKIYKFKYSDIPEYATAQETTLAADKISVISFKYSNNLVPVKTTNNHTKFDCEAMIVDNGNIHLFSKNWIDLNSTHYVINNTLPGSYIADSLETLETGYLVTGADKAPGQKVVALLGYVTTNLGNHFMHLLTEYNNGFYFNGNKRKLDLPNATEMGQAEGIVFRNERYGYISNERVSYGPYVVNQQLHSFDLTPFLNWSMGVAYPISFIKAGAMQINDKVQVDWQATGESNVQSYEIEKSKDGKQFTKVGSTVGNGQNGINSYSWMDVKPFGSNNFYRIKAISKTGEVKYSGIVKVKIGSNVSSITVYPNPVKNNSLTVRFENENKGTYIVTLFNLLGQSVFTRMIEHEGGSLTKSLQLSKAVSKGNYQLQIIGGEHKMNQKIIID